MGTVLPRNPLEKVQFCENHTTPWSANAVAIGTTAAAVTDLQTKTTAARAAFNAQQAARQAAKVATSAYHQAVTAMASAASDIIKQVKAKAATGGDSIYNLAEIPSPATPSPVGPPGTPYEFVAQLDQTGVLRLAWTCDNPAGASGTVYQVSRQIGATGAMQIIGAAGDKKFTDPSVPAGTAQVTYRVQALRSTVAGQPGEFTVKFGAAPGSGELTASVVAAPKLAA
jgi:hypothetical protein